MAQTSAAVDIWQPLVNNIPDDLLPKFDPQFVQLYDRYNAGRLN
jgi:hypothetical protein